MDVLAPIAEVTRRLPRPVAAKVGWHLGHRAPRVDRVARIPGAGRLVVDIGDYSHREMFFMGEYEPPTTRLFRRLATPGWTVLDVGANIGYFSLLTAAAGAPGARVVGFEPNPRMSSMLARSIRLNPDLGIRLERLALGDHSGVLPLHLSSAERNGGLSSLCTDRPETDGGTILVTVTTLDDYCTREQLAPDLIKIDVEGFEMQVLQGAGELLRRRVPAAITCEIAPQLASPEPLLELMRGYGYVPHTIAQDGELRADVTIGPGRVIDNVCFTRHSPASAASHLGRPRADREGAG